jgi:hypothetical protein
MKKVNLTGSVTGSQEITSRTALSNCNGRICVKKVDEEGNRQENKKKCQIEKLLTFAFHIINFNFS